MMLYIPSIDDYLKILTDEEVENFVVVDFSEYFKSIREEENLIIVANSFHIFLKTSQKVEKYVQSNFSDNYMHH